MPPRQGTANAAQELTKSEFPISILVWAGMKSAYPPTAIPVNSFSYVLNADFIDPNTVTSRYGAGLLYDKATSGTSYGQGRTLVAIEFNQENPTSNLICVTSDGNVFQTPTVLNPDSASIPYMSLEGTISTGVQLTNITTAQFLNKLYICDGYSLFSYSPSDSPKVQNVTSVLTTAGATGNPLFIITHLSRLWVLTDTDELFSSDINDPSNFSTGQAWDVTIARSDGMSNKSMTPWGKSLLITKLDTTTYKSAIYKLSGSSTSDFRIDPLFGDAKTPTGFLGRSAVRIGNDVIGLTLDGFSAISSIDTFQEAAVSNLSSDIEDFIRRINFDASDKIRAIYDPITKQYFCACPIDLSAENNIIFVYDVRTKRWGLYDNWPVLEFFTIKNYVCFVGNTYGLDDGTGATYERNIIFQTRTENSTDYVFGDYSSVLETGDLHFDSPETLKLFKSVDISNAQIDDYELLFTPITDGNYNRATTTKLSFISGGTRIGEFTTDVDKLDSTPNTQQTIPIVLRGKTLRLRLENVPGGVFSLRSLTFRVMVTDSGTTVAAATASKVIT